jgi:hypothetical protein
VWAEDRSTVRRLVPLAFVLVALLALLAPAAATAGVNGDPDHDGVDNRNEHREGTNPRVRDSDRDGRADGREDADRDGLSNAAEDSSGNDPIDPDSDDDGLRDGRERAGTVASYSDGVLRIRLATGGIVEGAVDQTTELDCRTETRLERGQHGRGAARGKRSTRRGRSAQVGEGDEDADPEDESSDDDPASDESEDDDWGEDSDGSVAYEEDWDDEGSGEPSGSCAVKRLRRGARVHQAERYAGSFLAVELVR